MNKILEIYNLPILNHKEIENMKRLITSKEIKSIIQNFPINKSLGQDSWLGEFHQIYKKELIPIIFKLFKKIKREHFYTNFAKPVFPFIKTRPGHKIKENYRPISLKNIKEFKAKFLNIYFKIN